MKSVVRDMPDAQTQINLFEGEWTYRLPIEGVSSGIANDFLYLSGSVWLAQQTFGDLSGLSCLELGPNEGEISFHLHHAGLKPILSIEGRTRSFLKCLIVKNLLHLDSVQFRLGDFVRFLEDSDREFDIILASGILYHMTEPLKVIENITRRTHRVVVATHYFLDTLLKVDNKNDTTGLPLTTWNVQGISNVTHKGFSARHYRYDYCIPMDKHETFGHGGLAEFSYLLELDAILDAFRFFGFEVVGEILNDPNGERGPHVIFCAKRASNRFVV